MSRAALSGCDRAVNSRCAAADDSHTSIKLERLFLREEINHLDGEMFVFDAELNWSPETCGHANGIVSLPKELLRIFHDRTGPGGDRTEGKQELDIRLDYSLVQPLVGDEIHHTAERVAAFEDIYS